MHNDNEERDINSTDVNAGGDVTGVGLHGSGIICGKEVRYTVNGTVINLHVDNLSTGAIENLRNILSVQTQLPATDATKDDDKNDVTKLVQLQETQQKITSVLHDVKQIEKKEGTQIQKIIAGDFQFSTDDLFIKDALAKGGELFYKGQYNDALRWQEKTIVLDANKADAWYNKGVILGKLGKSTEAIKCYDKAIEIRPDNADVFYNKGVILGKLGKYKEAIKCFDKTIEIRPDHASAWYNKGVSFENLRKYKQAVKCYNKVKTIGMFIE